MATEIIPFDPADTASKLPAEYRDLLPTDMSEFTEEFSAGVSISFPVISIKGKTFTVKEGEERRVLTRPDDPDSPASYIDVVVIAANKGVAKAYYEKSYTEDATDAPNCWSNDGVAPDPSVEKPVAKSCKTCPYNQFGSRITDEGKKAKKCSDSKRLAVAPLDDLLNPMLLRVPATSLKNWQQYVNLLARKGVTPMVVLTRIRFNMDAAYPLLEFKPVGLLPPEKAKEVKAARELEVVDYITGKIIVPTAATTAAVEEVEEEDEPLQTIEVPVEEVKSEPAQAEKPAKKPAKKQAKKAASKPEPAEVVEDDPEVDAILDGIDDL